MEAHFQDATDSTTATDALCEISSCQHMQKHFHIFPRCLFFASLDLQLKSLPIDI